MKMDWVSLHTHSCFSHGDGAKQPAAHVERVVELGMNALALTEHRNTSSHVDLEQAANEAGIKPIFGIEFDVALRDEPRRRHFHQTVLAMNQEGYLNLNRLVTMAWEQTKYVPRLYVDQLLEPELTAGLIVTSGCADSWLACTLLGGKSLGEKRDDWLDEHKQAAVSLARQYQRCYGDRFYLEMQAFPELERSTLLNQFYADLSGHLGVRKVATMDVHYPHASDNAVQRMLHAAHRGGTVETQDADWEYDVRLTYPESDSALLNRLCDQQLTHREALNALDGAREIADRCNVELPKSSSIRYIGAGFDPEKTTSEDLLKEWIENGIDYRSDTNPRFADDWAAREDEYIERIRYETGLIVSKGFPDYFLVCSDLIVWAKEQGIGVGGGRGSASGSLVAYLLRITEINPMQFPLMQFERFIDPSRPDEPDIDIDFQDDRRWEVIERARAIYGVDKVSQIALYARYRGRSAIKDTQRAYEAHVPFGAAMDLKNFIVDRGDGDARENNSVEDAIAAFPRAAEIVATYPELKMAMAIEGDYRGFGKHAAGVVISNLPIVQTCPVYTRVNQETNEVTRTIAYDKRGAEYLGMLKLDFLGLKTLGMISDVIGWTDLNWETIYALPFDDPKVIEMVRQSDLTGIFQFEGRTTKGVLEKVFANPSTVPTFQHLADITSLSRPGALISGQTDKYAAVEQGAQELSLWGHPAVDEVLAETNGSLVYQEQVMAMGRAAGMPGARVGALRRIIGKKKQGGAFDEFWAEFRDGMVAEVGMSEGEAKRLWDYMAASSAYLFNIAHAVSYTQISYWCAYLKLYHPVEFYAASLRRADKEHALELMQDAARHGIKVLPPKLSESETTWIPHRGSILAGFSQVDGVGDRIAGKIAAWRDEQFGYVTDQPRPNATFKRVALDHNGWGQMRYVKGKTGRKTKPDEPSQGVSGVGAATIAQFEAMSESSDPFGIYTAGRAVDAVVTAIAAGEAPLLGGNIGASLLDSVVDERVVFIGLIKEIRIIDVIEDMRKREPSKTADELRAGLKDRHLTTKAKVICVDEAGIDVHVNVHRYLYPEVAADLAEATASDDVIHVVGIARESYGPTVQAEQVTIIADVRSQL